MKKQKKGMHIGHYYVKCKPITVILLCIIVLALAAALGGAQSWGSLPTDQAPLAAQAAVVIAAGVSLALAAAALPAARAVPSALTTLHPAGGAR